MAISDYRGNGNGRITGLTGGKAHFGEILRDI